MSFFCGDWFLAKYAHNFFAKSLLPRSQHHLALVAGAVDSPSAVCMACWHFRRKPLLEDEFHIVCVCPEYPIAFTTGSESACKLRAQHNA